MLIDRGTGVIRKVLIACIWGCVTSTLPSIEAHHLGMSSLSTLPWRVTQNYWEGPPCHWKDLTQIFCQGSLILAFWDFSVMVDTFSMHFM